MRECEGFIKVIGSAGGEEQVKQNIQRQLAFRLQELTQQQRLQQRRYMDKLKKIFSGDEVQEDEFEDNPNDEVFDDLGELDLERNESLNQLVNNLNELAYLFKDLASLVVDQGTLLDRIDFNIQESADKTRLGLVHLQKVIVM